MSDRFHHEDDIQAAYESAEMRVRHLVITEAILLPDNREPHQSQTIKLVARDIADAVIRSHPEYGDISEIHGIKIERVS